MIPKRMLVATEGPEGLGIPMSTIAKICRETGPPDVLLAIEGVDRREPGRPSKDEVIGGDATNYKADKQQLKKAYKICPDASILTLAMVCARIDRQNSYRVFWVFA